MVFLKITIMIIAKKCSGTLSRNTLFKKKNVESKMENWFHSYMFLISFSLLNLVPIANAWPQGNYVVLYISVSWSVEGADNGTYLIELLRF